MDSSILQFLFSLIPVITPLLVFIACCIYINKIARIDSIFLCLGSGITLLISVMYVFMPFIMQSSAMPAGEVNFYYSALGMIAFLGGVSFAVGLFLLINNMINANKLLHGKF